MDNSFFSFRIFKKITDECTKQALKDNKAVYCEDIILRFLEDKKIPSKIKMYEDNIIEVKSKLSEMITQHPTKFVGEDIVYHSDVEQFLQIFKMLEDVIKYKPSEDVVYYTFLLNSYFSTNDEIRNIFENSGLNKKFINKIQQYIDESELMMEDSENSEMDFLNQQLHNMLQNSVQFPNIKIKMFKSPEELEELEESSSIFSQLMPQLNKKSKSSDIETYCNNVNEMIKNKGWSKIIGREKELYQLQQILLRKDKPNAILIGQPGIGKTKIVQGLAYLINKKEVQPILQDYIIYELNLLSLISGTTLRGQFEERINNIIKELKEMKNVILYIDEIHMIKKDSGGSADSFDLASALKPLLTTGSIRVIGSTTNEEYTSSFGKDKALQRRFQNMYIESPSKEETLIILKGIKGKYENYHCVKYPVAILNLIIELSDRYMSDKCFPDKAIDLLDSIGAYCQLQYKSDLKEKYKVETNDVYMVLSDILKIQVSNLSKSEQDRLKNLGSDLNSLIIGQERAIEKIVNGIIISKSGLRERNKTALTLFLKGKTGIGKTFCIQKLSELLNIPLFRYDMSEFMEEHSVSKLIGSPPGYKGYEDGRAGSGLLITQIKSNPNCIILFDEIEKAHPKVQNIFLQLMDNGKLTSSSGVEADFSNAFVFMTSNIGANQSHRMKHIGFGSNADENASDTFFDESFSPEFRNRLDGAITFNDLTDEVLNKITENTLLELKTLLESKKVKTSYNKDVVDYITQKAKEENLGARPIKRIIHNEIKNIISKELVYGKLSNGGKLAISMKDKELVFSY